MPLHHLVDVRVVDPGVADAAEHEVRGQPLVQHPVDGAEQFDLPLVVHRVAGVVEEGRQRRVQAEPAQHGRPVDGGQLTGRPGVADGAAADKALVGVAAHRVVDRQPGEELLERGVGEVGVEVLVAGREEVDQVGVVGHQVVHPDVPRAVLVVQVGELLVAAHHRLVPGQRVAGVLGGEFGLGAEELQQPFHLGAVDLLGDRHVALHGADHHLAPVRAEGRRHQVVVVRLVGVQHGLLVGEALADEADAVHLVGQRLEEDQVVALAPVRRVEPVRQLVEQLVGQEVEVDAVQAQQVRGGRQRDPHLGGEALAPGLRVEHDGQLVLVPVVERLQVVVAPQVVQPAVGRGDDGDAVALVGHGLGEVPEVDGGAALDEAVVEAAALEVSLDDVHGCQSFALAAGRPVASTACRRLIAAW